MEITIYHTRIVKIEHRIKACRNKGGKGVHCSHPIIEVQQRLCSSIAINKVKISIISSLKKIPVLFIQFPEINGIGFQFRQSNGIEFQFREVDGIEINSVNHRIVAFKSLPVCINKF